MISDEQLVHRHHGRQGTTGARTEYGYGLQDVKQRPRGNIFVSLLRSAHSINITLFMSLFFYFFSCAILLYAFRLHKRDLVIQERLVEKLSTMDLNPANIATARSKIDEHIPVDKQQLGDFNQGQGQDDGQNLRTNPVQVRNPDNRDADMQENMKEVSTEIEFNVAGLFVDLKDALNVDFPVQKEEMVSQEIYETGFAPTEKHGASLDQEDRVRFFVAITSECCKQRGRERRQAIRDTWKSDALSKRSNIEIRFVLGQPDPENGDITAIHKRLQDELVFAGGDMLMIRGVDHYRNLRNKTIRLFRFALTSPNKFTHVLKTDDDCYVRIKYVLAAIMDKDVDPPQPRMDGLYLGCVENRGGFQPVRDPKSKWYISKEEMSDSVAPWGQRYLSGWGYVLSRDVIIFLIKKVDQYDKHPEQQPGWYPAMHWEDVLVGLIVQEMVGEPQPHPAFKPAWRSCTNETAIRHLDVDSPLLLPGLFEQDRSGLWDAKTVQCSSGVFVAGDYWGWLNWRNSLENVQPI
eukprot:TRINITY_DN3086_c0_g3_i1.p1 TRINITY_DN3086_c0_g3~~TRINITY_DN3086_c0_g3_i1.p1  ORF type:complete len:519 (+),score=67.19 TRINITY_DN3086_c0_g3_i1:85-1641(+)